MQIALCHCDDVTMSQPCAYLASICNHVWFTGTSIIGSVLPWMSFAQSWFYCWMLLWLVSWLHWITMGMHSKHVCDHNFIWIDRWSKTKTRFSVTWCRGQLLKTWSFQKSVWCKQSLFDSPISDESKPIDLHCLRIWINAE